MQLLRRFLTAVPGVLCLLAAGVMGVATFLPYTGGYWGDGLLTANETQSLTTMNIVGGSDVWLVLGTVVILGVVAAYHLGGVRRPAAGFIALALALVSVGLAIKLPSTWKLDGVTYGEPYLLFAGFYVFFAGALTAVVGALLLVATGLIPVSHTARAQTSGGEPQARTYEGSG
jgi:hypothetical protein